MGKDNFTKSWIIESSLGVVSQYAPGVLTIRALHYQLVGLGMTNDIQHYKRVVSAMINARWDGLIAFDTFSDLDREMVGETQFQQTILEDKIEDGKRNIRDWMNGYWKNPWENQEYYPEVFIEKKALQGVFGDVCKKWAVALGACKGYPSLTFLRDAFIRFQEAYDQNKKPIILYFGDYDPSGEDIPRSIEDNLYKFGVAVEVRRIALMQDQVEEWNLPPAPTKEYKLGKRRDGSIGYIGDTRDKKWGGLGQVELDAVKPERMMELLESAIQEIFDNHAYDELKDIEVEEREKYRKELKLFVDTL